MKRASLASGIGLLGLIAGVLLATMPAAGATPRAFKGVVLAKNSQRHTIVVASASGVVRTVRLASVQERVGTRVSVTARQLRDGTFSATRLSVNGFAKSAKIRHAIVVR